MVNLLAVETSSQACSVALIQCDGTQSVLTQEYTDAPRSHTQLTLPMIDKLLGNAALALTDLDAIAFSAGPGSFTGLRIGLSIVQGLAFGADLPVIGVSTLQVLAQGASEKFNLDNNSVIIPCFDARMGENYWGIYQLSNGRVKTVVEDSLSAPESIAANFVTDNPTLGVGDGWVNSDKFPYSADTIEPVLQPEAQYLARLALPLLKSGNAVSVGEAELIYLRESVSWKKRQRLREK